MEERCGEEEGRIEKILNAFLHLTGQDGWDHGMIIKGVKLLLFQSLAPPHR
jgi:hypothetical protein